MKLRKLGHLNGEPRKLQRKFEAAARTAFTFSEDISFYVLQRIQILKGTKTHRSLSKIREILVAPFEADQQLAFLNNKLSNQKREVAVMSQDSDLLVYKNVRYVYIYS